MFGRSFGWGICKIHIIRRLWNRLARPLSAARCHVHFIDLMNAPLQTTYTKLPVAWETACDTPSVEAHVRVLPMEQRSDVDDRLAQNHWCLVGLRDGVVVHAAWAGIGTFKAHWFDRWFRLQPSEVYLYGAYTMPEFRGQRLHPASAIERLRQARERGIQRGYWFVDPSNQAARQLPVKLGAARIGSAGYIEVAGIRLHYLTDIGHLTRSNPRIRVEKR